MSHLLFHIQNQSYQKAMSHHQNKTPVQSKSLESHDSVGRLAQWLKQLPVEERYLLVRLNHQTIVTWLREGFHRGLKDQPEAETTNCRPQRNNSKILFDMLVLSSQQTFLDTASLDFQLVDDVDRLLELLTKLAIRVKTQNSQLPTKPPNITSRQQLASFLSHYILIRVKERFLQKESGAQALHQERLRKRQYGAWWSNMTPEDKQNFLLLQCESLNDLKQHLSTTITLKQLQRQIKELLKMDRNQFCNRLLKCKLKRSNDPIRAYYRQLYENLQRRVEPKKIPLKRPNTMYRRTKTKSFSSNQTNETDADNNDRLQQKVNEFSRYKLQKDLEEYADLLSERANLHFQHRKVCFNRLQWILQPYSVELLLFGSCANGLALEGSDVDIAVSGSILAYFPYGSMKERIGYALESIQTLLSTHKWITSSKTILTAAIPVLKIQIDTALEIPPLESPLNVPKGQAKGTIIQVDITVDTRGLVEPENSHLGIRSSQLIGQWLAQTQGLYRVIILLKHLLYKRGLSTIYKGGLSPYCLFVMIKAYMRHSHVHQPLPTTLLQNFITFYCQQFNEYKQGVDLVKQPLPFYQREAQDSKIEIRDPLNGRVMTRNAHQYRNIKQELLRMKDYCMKYTRQRIKEVLTQMNREKMEKVLRMTPEDFFSFAEPHLPKNVFREYEMSVE